MTQESKWSFDDCSIGQTIDGNKTLHTREIERPHGLSNHDWYSHAAKVCKIIAATRTPNGDPQ